MSHEELIQLLLDAGFETGWAIAGETLIVWKHKENPPKPFTRPEVTDETPSPD